LTLGGLSAWLEAPFDLQNQQRMRHRWPVRVWSEMESWFFLYVIALLQIMMKISALIDNGY
jgi:hypothetical protein